MNSAGDALGISATDLDGELDGRVSSPQELEHAQVTVRFLSELISATRNTASEVVTGDPKRVKEVTDIWTFARDLSSRNPNWRLVATQQHN